MRKYAELLDMAELATVLELRAKEYGTTIGVICQRVGVAPDAWQGVREALSHHMLADLIKIARGVSVEIAVLEHPGGASWQDPTGAPKTIQRAGAGIYDGKLDELRAPGAARPLHRPIAMRTSYEGTVPLYRVDRSKWPPAVTVYMVPHIDALEACARAPSEYAMIDPAEPQLPVKAAPAGVQPEADRDRLD